jgi:hypothetical protein
MAQAVARAQTFRNAFTLTEARPDESQWAEFAAALEDDDFDTPRALAVMHRWASERQLGLLSRGLEIFGLTSLAHHAEAPAHVRASSPVTRHCGREHVRRLPAPRPKLGDGKPAEADVAERTSRT